MIINYFPQNSSKCPKLTFLGPKCPKIMFFGQKIKVSLKVVLQEIRILAWILDSIHWTHLSQPDSSSKEVWTEIDQFRIHQDNSRKRRPIGWQFFLSYKNANEGPDTK